MMIAFINLGEEYIPCRISSVLIERVIGNDEVLGLIPRCGFKLGTVPGEQNTSRKINFLDIFSKCIL